MLHRGRKMNSNLEAAIQEAMSELDRQMAEQSTVRSSSTATERSQKTHDGKKRKWLQCSRLPVFFLLNFAMQCVVNLLCVMSREREREWCDDVLNWLHNTQVADTEILSTLMHLLRWDYWSDSLLEPPMDCWWYFILSSPKTVLWCNLYATWMRTYK